MDERLQHQCAGFMQAEAQAFADELARHEDDDDDAKTIMDDTNSEEETPVKASQAKNSKSKSTAPKKTKTLPAVERVPRNQAVYLASEYAFISLVSYFLRAVVSNSINARHSSVLLAYYGRLGVQFDHCLSTVINVLREEGMFMKNGGLVEAVVSESLRQVCRPLPLCSISAH
jgi:cohesin complex subunit SA-1/2